MNMLTNVNKMLHQENVFNFTMKNTRMFLSITWLLLLLLFLSISLPANVGCIDQQNDINNNLVINDKNESSSNFNNNSNVTEINNNHATQMNSNQSLVLPSTTPDTEFNGHERECDSIDIRNDCDTLLRLTGCTVIRGFLMIVLLPKSQQACNCSESSNKIAVNDTCDYERYQFPLLREITEYAVFYQMKGLRSFKSLFPNLTVIRGRRLFLHYALSIYAMPDLERLEFPSLLAIQNGEVFISSTPKLCEVEKINWSFLTKTPNQNYIFPMNTANKTCPKKSKNYCSHCLTNSCWSSEVCQLLDTTNTTKHVGNASLVNDVTQANSYCTDDCLGGCRNGTHDCVVCRYLTAHDKCVSTCPQNTYLVEHSQRCVTHDECAELKHFINYTNCLSTCPKGYVNNTNTHECLPCPPGSNCSEICQPLTPMLFTISTLHDAEYIQGCHTLNGTLMIVIRNPIDELLLKQKFSELREVNGHVKIADSPYLSSLDFLSGLKRINGKPLENDMYSLIVYSNPKLKTLWWPANNSVDLGAGGIYVHRNHLLCNSELYAFRERIQHNHTRDSLQFNNEAVLCGAKEIIASVEVFSTTELSVSWSMQQSAVYTYIFWREVPHNANLTELRHLTEQDDDDICTDGYWDRRELLKNEINYNDTHYHYNITALKSNTRYVVLLRTFGAERTNVSFDSGYGVTLTDVKLEAYSELLVKLTKAGMPTPPQLIVVAKTNSTLSLQLIPKNRTYEDISYYELSVYELPNAVPENRNYCNQPALYVEGRRKTNQREDYANCCTRRVEAVEDAAFAVDIHTDFEDNQKSNFFSPQPNFTTKLYNLTYTIERLTSYGHYALQVRACITSYNATVCGSHSLHNERTNYTVDADNVVNLSACWSQAQQRYYVNFRAPVQPNGFILFYMLHLNGPVLPNGYHETKTQCISRQEHFANGYQFSMRMSSYKLDSVAVRAYSLATNVWSPIVSIGVCDSDISMKIAGTVHQAHGANVFIVCFLLGAIGTCLWVCYKRRYWRKCGELRNLRPPACLYNWRMLLPQRRDTTNMEDRMMLVDGFETVRFHNSDDEEHKYLE